MTPQVAFLLVLVLLNHARVEVRVNPAVLQQGDTVRVTCRVDPHPDNRWLTMGITGYRETGVQIDGERGPITTELFYAHVPCSTDVFCRVLDNAGRSFEAHTRLLVADCEGL